MKIPIFAQRHYIVLADVARWNIRYSRGDEWPLLGAFNQWLAQCSQSPAPPGERLMGTGYFFSPSTSLPRIWGRNCVCFACCFVPQADKEEPAGWSSGTASQGAIRNGRMRSRKGKRVKRAWSVWGQTELKEKYIFLPSCQVLKFFCFWIFD